VHPVGTRLFIKPGEVTNRIGAIWIPETSERQCTHGTVLDIGEEVEYVRVGDHVIYGQHAGDTITVDGQAILVLTPKDIVAVVDSSAVEVLDA
jgi:co-chaperonin GroES (HSP10)